MYRSKNILVFILHVTTSKNVFKMLYAKTFAKMLQSIIEIITFCDRVVATARTYTHDILLFDVLCR